VRVSQKISFPVFGDIHRIFLVDFAPHDVMVTAIVCQALLNVKEAI
jgi:hypothetical protein